MYSHFLFEIIGTILIVTVLVIVAATSTSEGNISDSFTC